MEEKRRSLIQSLILRGDIKSERLVRAMTRVPREMFVPEDKRELAYEDMPLPIGYGQTISAPGVVARMTELLSPQEGDKVLEIGTGSGYQAAILAELVGPSGRVITIERIGEIARIARERLERLGYGDRVKVVIGDGSEGYPPEAPYDRIMVTAAAPSLPPPLVSQLRAGGRIVIPIGSRYVQSLYIIEKSLTGEVRMMRDIDVIFVPLIGTHGWRE